MKPDIESIEEISPFDPVLADIKSKATIRWRDFRDLKPRLIRISRLDKDGVPYPPKVIAEKVLEMRRRVYRAASEAGLGHEMHWDPDLFVLAVQLVHKEGEDGPNLVNPHRIKGLVGAVEKRLNNRTAAEQAAREPEF